MRGIASLRAACAENSEVDRATNEAPKKQAIYFRGVPTNGRFRSLPIDGRFEREASTQTNQNVQIQFISLLRLVATFLGELRN